LTFYLLTENYLIILNICPVTFCNIAAVLPLITLSEKPPSKPKAAYDIYSLGGFFSCIKYGRKKRKQSTKRREKRTITSPNAAIVKN
jgi:hypothetical protein